MSEEGKIVCINTKPTTHYPSILTKNYALTEVVPRLDIPPEL